MSQFVPCIIFNYFNNKTYTRHAMSIILDNFPDDGKQLKPGRQGDSKINLENLISDFGFSEELGTMSDKVALIQPLQLFSFCYMTS